MEKKYDIKFAPPDITQAEIDEVTDTLKSGWLTTGKKTKLLEQRLSEYTGNKKTACFNSATAAMELVLRLFGIGEGDEVITSAYTYAATANVICHVGATPIIVDTEPESPEISADAVRKAITSKTKAVIPIDIGGVICDYDRLRDILSDNKNRLFSPNCEMQETYGRALLLSDAAHSFGSVRNGLQSGMHADFSCFSFHAVKNLAMGEGGAATWKSHENLDDDYVYRQLMLLSLHGQSKDALAKTTAGGWEYDILFPGYKCNMTDVMAAIGLVQLARYNGLLARRRELEKIYNDIIKLLPNNSISTLVHEGEGFCSNRHLYIARPSGIDEAARNNIMRLLADERIPTNVHFKPLPMFTAYKNLGFDIKDFPNAYNMYKNAVSLPFHTLLTDDEAAFIAESFVRAAK